MADGDLGFRAGCKIFAWYLMQIVTIALLFYAATGNLPQDKGYLCIGFGIAAWAVSCLGCFYLHLKIRGDDVYGPHQRPPCKLSPSSGIFFLITFIMLAELAFDVVGNDGEKPDDIEIKAGIAIGLTAFSALDDIVTDMCTHWKDGNVPYYQMELTKMVYWLVVAGPLLILEPVFRYGCTPGWSILQWGLSHDKYGMSLTRLFIPKPELPDEPSRVDETKLRRLCEVPPDNTSEIKRHGLFKTARRLLRCEIIGSA